MSEKWPGWRCSSCHLLNWNSAKAIPDSVVNCCHRLLVRTQEVQSKAAKWLIGPVYVLTFVRVALLVTGARFGLFSFAFSGVKKGKATSDGAKAQN